MFTIYSMLGGNAKDPERRTVARGAIVLANAGRTEDQPLFMAGLNHDALTALLAEDPTINESAAASDKREADDETRPPSPWLTTRVRDRKVRNLLCPRPRADDF